MPFTGPTSEKVLAKILQGVDFTHPSSLEVSLHTGDPGDTGANEVSGGSYARQAETFSKVDQHHYHNDSDLIFNDMPACTVTYAGLWDGSGNFWWGGALAQSKSVDSGDSLVIKASELDVTT